MIRFACPGCDARFATDDEQAGKAGECPGCGTRFRIPDAASRPAPTAGGDSLATCPHCHQAARVDAADLGHPVACPGCGETYTPGEAALAPRRRGRGDPSPPQALRTAGSLLIAGGVYGLVHAFAIPVLSGGVCCVCLLWPPWYAMVGWCFWAFIRGTAYHSLSPLAAGRPRGLQIAQVLCILNLDAINCILGVIGLVLCSGPEVRNYFARDERYRSDD